MILYLPWIPIATAFLMLFVPESQDRLIRRLTLGACSVCFAITVSLLVNFEIGNAGYQYVQRFDWVPSLGISYQVGLDGINMTLCLLHALVSLAGAFMSCSVSKRAKEYHIFFLLLVGAIYGVFTVLDLFFLYLFYEMTLIPLYPMIGIWGSKNKEYGAMQLTLFITAGAVIALFGLLVLYHRMGANSFDLIRMADTLKAAPLDQSIQNWIAPFLLIGFGVIASLWPLHSWSPIGYAAAPTSVSMLHAGVLKKMGPYMILRVAVTLLPDGVAHWATPLAVLAAIGILYAGYAAIRQQDLKFIIGFSSVSHMGYVLLGIAALTPVALSGAVFLMFSHGVMAACTFALVGFIYEQSHMRGIADFGGLAKQIPFVGMCLVMACMASLGLPGFSNFASELVVFIGTWPRYPLIVCLAVFGILITAIYLLRTVQQVCYGPPNPRWSQIKDAVTLFEKFPFLLLLGALLLFGFWPQGLLRIIGPTVEAILS
ncbi:MAG: NADH-quinone oxidoreductase subunit M [Candidatus Omnitrophota bacterium]|nr:NADH-quinone oxidoreductase subunit M [Candidatus Omnitrophota bacterium]